jgi:hypothetical protein
MEAFEHCDIHSVIDSMYFGPHIYRETYCRCALESRPSALSEPQLIRLTAKMATMSYVLVSNASSERAVPAFYTSAPRTIKSHMEHDWGSKLLKGRHSIDEVLFSFGAKIWSKTTS